MLKKTLIGLTMVAMSVVMLACQQAQESNTNTNASEAATRTAPDNSEITTTTDSNGTRTETRVFRDNPRVSKVVVTTSNGQRTVKVYSKSGEERDLKPFRDDHRARRLARSQRFSDLFSRGRRNHDP